MKRTRSGNTNQATKKSKLGSNDPMLEVFSNDVIVRRLEKMLSLTDLKNLRLVNRQLNSQVILRTTFTSRICVTINKDLISSRVLQNVTFPLKVVRIQCFCADPSRTRFCKNGCFRNYFGMNISPRTWTNQSLLTHHGVQNRPSKVWLPDEIEHIYDSLEHVEELSVFCPESEFGASCFCDAKRLGASFQLFPSVNRIIQNSRKTLKKLMLYSTWLHHVLEDYDGSLRSCLKHVTHLEVGGGWNSKSKIPDSLSSLRKLQYFKAGDKWYPTAQDGAVIEQLLRSNLKVFRSLVLHHDFYAASDNIWTRIASSKFSNLRHVDFQFRAGRGEHVQSILKFLQNHKNSLQSLRFKLVGFQVTFPAEILSILPILPKLKELDLRCDSYCTLVVEQLVVLKKCSELQSLQIFLESYTHRDNGMKLPLVFNYIPANLRHLSVSGCSSYDGPPLSGPSVGKLTNLQSLHLLGCYAAVSNETLQGIFTNLKLLKELVITKADKCNSEGFLGNGSSDAASIKDLTRLEKLVLNYCNLTDAIIYKAIEFPNLKFLDISNNESVTRSLRLRYILTRNPLLELLRSGINKICRQNEVLELKKFHPSLRFLQFKNFGPLVNVQ